MHECLLSPTVNNIQPLKFILSFQEPDMECVFGFLGTFIVGRGKVNVNDSIQWYTSLRLTLTALKQSTK